MKNISRRAALQIVTSAPVAAALVWTPAEAAQAHEHATNAQAQAAKAATPFKPKFFTAHEYATVVVLVDLIIPRDARSGSATDAGVPAFMDFMMIDQPRR
jgi:gluconate 2-dehydrogenase gamma chain